jgi:hypothetical protein
VLFGGYPHGNLIKPINQPDLGVEYLKKRKRKKRRKIL